MKPAAGTSDLVIASNNHFGIKCKAAGRARSFIMMMMPRENVSAVMPWQSDSYRDHSDYLSQTPRYAFLFKLNPEDYEGWAYGLKKAGYATNMKYSQILIKLIEDYDLQKYSLIAMGKLPAEQPVEGSLASEMMRESLTGFTDSSMQEAVPRPLYIRTAHFPSTPQNVFMPRRVYPSFPFKPI